MRIFEVTKVEQVYTFCKDFFETEFTKYSYKFHTMDYSETFSFFQRMFKRFDTAVAAQNFVTFPIQMQPLPSKASLGGQLEFFSTDQGETVHHGVLRINLGGWDGKGLVDDRSRVLLHLINVTTHEIGHAMQVNQRTPRLVHATPASDNPEFFQYLTRAIEREMQALSAAIEINHIATTNHMTLRDFLKMISSDVGRLIDYIRSNDTLFGLTNMFIKFKEYPDSPTKTRAYRKFLKTFYHYAMQIEEINASRPL